jgi:hypothetical protein
MVIARGAKAKSQNSYDHDLQHSSHSFAMKYIVFSMVNIYMAGFDGLLYDNELLTFLTSLQL